MKNKRRFVSCGKLFIVSVFVLFLGSLPATSFAAEADLTRYLAEHERTTGGPNIFTDSFFGTVGEGTLVVLAGNVKNATISLNGSQILGPQDFKQEQIEVPVDLLADNSITVEMRGKPGSQLNVRVTQHVVVDFQATTYTTYSGPTRDYDLSEAFYADLGWTTGLRFPDMNTPEVAAALGIVGIPGGYDIHVELRILTHGQQLSFIDLIQFFNPVRDLDDTPYPFLYHLGMTHVAYVTTDLDADYAYLVGKGVPFLSAPVGIPGERFGRFATLKDPDGTFIQLVEVPNPGAGPTPCDPENLPPSTTPLGVPDDPPVFYPCPQTHLVRPAYVNVNVSDFEGAREFFRMLGFTESVPLPEMSTAAEAQAMGLTQPFSVIGADLTVPDEVVPGGGVAIRLMQWIDPTDDEPPYPLPVNHPGIQRLVYGSINSTDNLLVDKVAALEAQGVEFVSPPAPCCSGPASTSGIVLWFGPDGMLFETGGAIIPEAP